MRVLGLITEYNPFHNGHLYHLDQAKALVKPDVVVAVMSGNFLQRGEPAIMDKWTRAKTAVLAGVDLVIELPTFFATASAEGFALGSLALLTKLGVTDLVFGSEDGRIEGLKAVADLIEAPTPAYQEVLQSMLDQGVSFPVARQAAIDTVLPAQVAYKANNILGIEYLRAIKRLGSPIQPQTIKRINNDYNDEQITSSIASATAVRKQLKMRPVDWSLIKTVVPETTYKALWDSNVYTVLDDFHQMFNAILLREGPTGIRTYRDVAEGLEFRLWDEITSLGTLEDMAMAVKSKRYTLTRIQRIITNVLLGIGPMQDDLAISYLDYARLLAFTPNGGKYIRQVKKSSELAVFTNLGRDLKKYRRDNPLLALDIRATGLYAQVNHSVSVTEDYTRKPYGLND